MRFQVLESEHFQNGKRYVKGDIIDTKIPLDELFVNKFRRLATEPTAVAPATPAEEPKAKEEDIEVIVDDSVPEPEPVKEAFGSNTDVTAQFKDAEKAGVKVFRRGPRYFIVDAGHPEEVLHRCPKKSDVEEFIAGQLAGL